MTAADRHVRPRAQEQVESSGTSAAFPPPNGVPEDLDLLRPWLPLIRRLRKEAKDGGHCAVLSLRVIVDQDGTPRHWTMPQRLSLEPRASSEDLVKLLNTLAGPQT
jgi:hypothetical protein